MVGWTSIALAAEKGALLGSLLGCFSGLVNIFQKFREQATSAPPPTGPAAPLKRSRPWGSSDEAPATSKIAVKREPSMRLLGDQVAAERPRWQVVRQELPDTAFLILFSRLAYEAKCGQLHSEYWKPAKECKAATLVEDELACFDGNPLQIESFEFSPGRTHLKVTYPGNSTGTVAFVCNFDLPCCDSNAATTRCLPCSIPDSGLYPGGVGHTALLVLLLCELGRSQPRLTRSVVCLFLAAHRHGEGGCADLLVKGHLDELAHGPVYWLDGAASPLQEWSSGKPSICTGALGSLSWMLRVRSDMNQVTPSVELAAQAVASMQDSFDKDFTANAPQVPGASADAGTYLRCTRMETQEKDAQHAETQVQGIIRLAPFHPIIEVLASIQEYVAEVNSRVARRQPGQPLTVRRTLSNEDEDAAVAPKRRRRSQRERSPPPLPSQGLPAGIFMELIWAQRPQGKERRLLSWPQKAPTLQAFSSPHTPKRRMTSLPGGPAIDLALDLEGISTKNDSLARRALEEALWEASPKQRVNPPVFRHFMVHGSVPHARRVQQAGGDVQLLGFLQPKIGKDNEELDEDSCSLDGMRYGYKVLLHIIKVLEQNTDSEVAESVSSEEMPKEPAQEGPAQSILVPEADVPTLHSAGGDVNAPATATKAETEIEDKDVDHIEVVHPIEKEMPEGQGNLTTTVRRTRSVDGTDEASTAAPLRRCFSDSFQPQKTDQEAEAKIEWPEREGREGVREADRTSWLPSASEAARRNSSATRRSPRSPSPKDEKRSPVKRVQEVIKHFERTATAATSSSSASAVPKVAAKKAAAKKAAAKSEAASKKAAAKKTSARKTIPKIKS